MPIKEAAKKALRQSIKNRERNRTAKEGIRKLKKVTDKLVISKKVEDALKGLHDLQKSVDKAVQKKIMKKNTAARIKSRLAKRVNALIKK